MWLLSNFPRDDVLSAMLQTVRVRSTIYCRSELTAPWGFRVAAREVASFHLVVAGSCWLEVDGIDPPTQLTAGDLVILPSGHAHQVRDSLGSRVTLLDDILATHPMSDGLRLSYGGAGPRTDLLCGGFVVEAPETRSLLASLPPVVRVPGRSGRAVAWLETLFTLLRDELAAGSPGSEVVVARLADVLLTKILAACLARQGETASVGALRDPQIAATLRLIHEHPDHDWTVTRLAADVALSRSALASRFRRLTGEPPMRYLTHVRLTRAAACLRAGRDSLVEIARRTGYESDVTLSKAFKRQFGVPPGTYRKAAQLPPRGAFQEHIA
jgi:AraC family transcriptional regulator, alkane utilization regulator